MVHSHPQRTPSKFTLTNPTFPNSFDDYVPDDFDEPVEPEAEEEEPNAATLDPNEDLDPNKVIEVGGGNDPAARGPGRGKTTGGTRDKKIPKEKRNTTPYMTKYERARVLGTRALQIRYVLVKKERLLCGGIG